MPLHQKVRANRWCKFERTFSDHTAQTRYIREIIFGQRSTRTYWEITTDPETMPENSTSFVMINLPGKVHQIKKILGNLYGLRTWIGNEPECGRACEPDRIPRLNIASDSVNKSQPVYRNSIPVPAADPNTG